LGLTINTNYQKNPQKTVFLNAKMSGWDPSQVGDPQPGVGSDLVYRDPWGNPYIITMDLNYDELCEDAFYKSSTVSTGGLNGLILQSDGNYAYHGKVMVWSAGPNKKIDTGDPATDRAKDNGRECGQSGQRCIESERQAGAVGEYGHEMGCPDADAGENEDNAAERHHRLASPSIGNRAEDQRHGAETDHIAADGQAGGVRRDVETRGGIGQCRQGHVDPEPGQRNHQAEQENEGEGADGPAQGLFYGQDLGLAMVDGAGGKRSGALTLVARPRDWRSDIAGQFQFHAPAVTSVAFKHA